MTLRTISTSFTLAGISILVTGCNGGSHSPTMGALPSGPSQMQSPADRGRNHQGCPNDGGISVTPCRIKFDSNHSGPMSVTVMGGGNGDGNRHAIRENDDCASRSIATVAKNSNRQYTVSAGSVTGSCTAKFSDNGNRNDDEGGGGQHGGGTLRIVNGL